MFPSEDEKARETLLEQTWRRAGSGMDRRGLKQVAIAIVLIFGGMILFVAADVAGVERRRTTATVVGFVDRWTMKRAHECVTELWTGYGNARIYTRNMCRDAAWRLGDTAEVTARQLRFTRTIVVSTHGTIFEAAHSILPEG